MSNLEHLFKIDPENKHAEAVEEINFAQLGLQERKDIQEWIVANPNIVGEGLLIIAKEFSGFDRTNERADIVAVDRDGKVVIIELKRDDTGSDVHWQAIKYASYFNHADAEVITQMLADFHDISITEAENKLKQHMDTDDLAILNHDQRIVLASHRFAPEVTSAVLWLNQKAPGDDLITCVQLTPYRDSHTNSLLLQASTIIPIPGTEDFTVTVGTTKSGSRITSKSSHVRRKDDETTFLLREMARLAELDLPNELRPDKRSQRAGIGKDHRYFHVWYSFSPWSNWGMSYQLMLFAGSESAPEDLTISFKCQKALLKEHQEFSVIDIAGLETLIGKLDIFPDQKIINDNTWLSLEVSKSGQHLESSLMDNASLALSTLIKAITPAITEFEDARNEQ